MPGASAASVPVLADPAFPAAPIPSRAPSARWSDLRLRLISSVVLAPVVLGCLWSGGPYWGALMAVAGAGLALEWVALCGLPPGDWPGFGVVAAVLAGVALTASGRLELGAAALLIGAALVLPPVRWRLAAGVAYAGVGAVALTWLRLDPLAGRANLVFLVAVIWASDIGAYVAGRLIGGLKLAPAISPGKTWSGALGGLAAAMLAGCAAGQAMAPGAPVRAAALACLLAAASQAGDLMESAIKRGFGVKDSGRLIPGHGGLLDRLDGFLVAAPVAAALGLLVGRGTALWH